MSLRIFELGALGLLAFAGIHGCTADRDTTSSNNGGKGNGAATQGAGADGGSSGTTRVGAGASGATSEQAGASETTGAQGGSSGALGASGSSHGGRGHTSASDGGAQGRSGTGGTETNDGGRANGGGGTPPGSDGTNAEAGAGAGGEAGSEPTTNGGAPATSGGAPATSGGAPATSGGAPATSGGAPATNGGAPATNGGAGGAGPCVDTINLPLLSTPPATLDLTGLYASPSSLPTDTEPYVNTYTPHYTLWSDGANKTRWIYLPPCTQIDTSDMNHWVFPVGTRFWKEFRIGDALVETRFIHRFGPGGSDWLFAAYQWDPTIASPTAGNTAYVPGGMRDANGTEHDIPESWECEGCHGKLPERILGFSAFELTGSPGPLDMSVLSEQHLLTVPAPNGFTPPGTPTQQAGLGYLHANCGVCHNAFWNATPTSPPQMRLLVEQTTLESTDTYTTMVNVPTQNPDFAAYDRIEPGHHELSEIYLRMSIRDEESKDPPDQMPPIATKQVDSDGIAAVSAFIDSLTP